MALVDFHCHLDLYPDHEQLVSECDRLEIYTLAVTTTPKAWLRNYALARQTRYVRAALGLHPQVVRERAHELPLWENYLSQTRYIGEVGLDAGPRFYSSFELQRQVFQRILECCSIAGNKVISVHSVRAAKPTLDLIEQHFPPTRGRVVLHWFTGSQSEARRAADLGCYFSIGSEMARTARGRALIMALPADRILTETDGPFTYIDGRSARPRDIGAVIEAIAGIRGLTPENVANLVSSNLRNLLKMS